MRAQPERPDTPADRARDERHELRAADEEPGRTLREVKGRGDRLHRRPRTERDVARTSSSV